MNIAAARFVTCSTALARNERGHAGAPLLLAGGAWVSSMAAESGVTCSSALASSSVALQAWVRCLRRGGMAWMGAAENVEGSGVSPAGEARAAGEVSSWV